jgi:hypothetical protein
MGDVGDDDDDINGKPMEVELLLAAFQHDDR